MSGRGVFILFEGVDRAGKTTQANLLFEWMKVHIPRVVQLRFPDRTSDVGKSIDAFLKSKLKINDQALHLLFSANRWEHCTLIETYLRLGVNIVMDRYSFSGIAYSAAKGLELNWCSNTEFDLPAPDVVIYMDLPIEESMARAGFGEEVFEKADFQKEVQKQFLFLKEDNWEIIDATASKDVIHEKVKDIVRRTIEEKRETPIKRFS